MPDVSKATICLDGTEGNYEHELFKKYDDHDHVTKGLASGKDYVYVRCELMRAFV